MNKLYNNRSGIVLVLAIFMISTVIGTAAIFSNLIIRNLQQSRLVDQAIQAHYIAESGAEHALYQVRKREAVVPDKCDQLSAGSTCDESTGYCSGFSGEVSCITAGSGGLPFIENWLVEAEHEQTFRFFLSKGQNIQIDLFDPLQEISPVGELPSGIRKIFVEWGDLDHQLDLHHTLLTLTPGQETQEVVKGLAPKRDCAPGPCLFPTSDFVPKPASTLDDRKSYLLRLRAFEFIDDEAGPIQVSIFDDAFGGNQLPIPSRLIITTTGEYGDSQQRIQVQTPTRPPLSGLYDFVLFSEEEVVKN